MFRIQQLRHVHGQQTRRYQAESRQTFQWPHAELRLTLFDFGDGLMHVHVHRQVEFVGQHADAFQRCVGDGVGRVRCESGTQQRVIAQFIVQRQTFVQIFVGTAGPGAGEVDDDQADAGAHADLGGGARGDFRKEVHVVEAGGAAAQHLGHGEQAAVAHEFIAHPLGFGRPDVVIQPIHQRQIVGQAAQQRHGGVGVGVDETGDQRMFAALDDLVGLVAGAGLTLRKDVENPAILYGNAVVFEHDAVGLHGDDPTRVDEAVDVRHEAPPVRG